jgi:hypothetical protein
LWDVKQCPGSTGNVSAASSFCRRRTNRSRRGMLCGAGRSSSPLGARDRFYAGTSRCPGCQQDMFQKLAQRNLLSPNVYEYVKAWISARVSRACATLCTTSADASAAAAKQSCARHHLAKNSRADALGPPKTTTYATGSPVRDVRRAADLSAADLFPFR